MEDIDVSCPHCGEMAQAPADVVGKNAICPYCMKSFRIAAAGTPAAPLGRNKGVKLVLPMANPESEPEPINVIVTDVKMPFVSMIVFMIKWAIAAIPAMLILLVLWSLVFGVLVNGCRSLFGR